MKVDYVIVRPDATFVAPFFLLAAAHLNLSCIRDVRNIRYCQTPDADLRYTLSILWGLDSYHSLSAAMNNLNLGGFFRTALSCSYHASCMLYFYALCSFCFHLYEYTPHYPLTPSLFESPFFQSRHRCPQLVKRDVFSLP